MKKVGFCLWGMCNESPSRLLLFISSSLLSTKQGKFANAQVAGTPASVHVAAVEATLAAADAAASATLAAENAISKYANALTV